MIATYMKKSDCLVRCTMMNGPLGVGHEPQCLMAFSLEETPTFGRGFFTYRIMTLDWGFSPLRRIEYE
jgi:hypothetical protein